jgi:hypothetical protein
MNNNIALGFFDQVWGYIPTFLSLDDPRSAIEQFNDNYISGWNKFNGFVLDKKKLTLKYPGDPAYKPIDKMKFRDETIVIYPHSWVMVLKADGTYEVCRMD